MNKADKKRTPERWRKMLDARNIEARRWEKESVRLRALWESELSNYADAALKLKEANARIADLESKLTTTENFLSNSEGNILRLNGSVAMADKDFDKLLDRLVVLDAFKKEAHVA